MEKVVDNTTGAKSDSGKLTMILLNSGLFCIGMLVGGNKLVNPRLFTVFEDPAFDKEGNIIMDPQTGRQKTIQKMKMEPFPGLPSFMRIVNEPSYPISPASASIIALYEHVTTPPPVDMNMKLQ